jgi:hypothetical protein
MAVQGFILQWQSKVSFCNGSPRFHFAMAVQGFISGVHSATFVNLQPNTWNIQPSKVQHNISTILLFRLVTVVDIDSETS